MADATIPSVMPQGRTARPVAPPPMLAADGTPLRVSLSRALRRSKLQALLLIAPLLIFILMTFVLPIGDMLLRSVENGIVSRTLPRTIEALSQEPAAGPAGNPSEEVYAALYTDLVFAEATKRHTQLGTRLNYEWSGASSLFRGAGRDVGRFPTETVREAFEAAGPAYGDPAAWAAWMADPETRGSLSLTPDVYDAWARITQDVEGDDPAEEVPGDVVFVALARDLAATSEARGLPPVDTASLPPLSFTDLFIEADGSWGEPGIWSTLRAYSGPLTAGYYLNAVDLQATEDGIASRPDDERIYIQLFIRTLVMSGIITAACILLGYPVAWLLANLPARRANLLMILVLLPFWTSLLVRTSAWKVLLQQQGVINDVLVWVGLVANDGRLVMINNQTGTIIAMTHILLPFMILPLYSVMKGIPPSYLRAAKSLGANDWTAFWRVYFPQSVPGIGAGSILCFILSIGYYITPELVGGTHGVFISNRIAYHISTSLNWGLAAALGTVLLVLVLGLYWAYDRLVGIDNVKLGG